MDPNFPTHPTVRQAADQYGVSEKTIRRYIAQGLLKAERVGPRLIRIDPQSLRDLPRALTVSRAS